VTPWRITRGAPTLGSSNDAIDELLESAAELGGEPWPG
jgi:hypothetical protein